MTVGNKVTAYQYNKNDELLRTDTLNTETEEDSVVIYKNDKNGNQLVMELSEGGKVQKRYICGNDRGYGSNLVYTDKGTNTEKQYYVADPHGNVVQLTDESGNVTQAYEYDSFGNEVKPDGKDDNPFRYCGEYYDKETEEIYLRARYYQPAVGRFLTRDTYTGESDEPESLHLYTYCENDGVNAWDPSGHEEIVVSGGVYSKSKQNNGKYYYEFIEPALKKINELRKENKKKIIWLIADQGWTKRDKEWISQATNSIYVSKVKIVYRKSKRDIMNFLRYNRVNKNEKIHSFTVFAHGAKDKIMFGYDGASEHSELTLTKRDIEYIRKKSFAKDLVSVFYSCRTASGGSNSFASKWHKKTGARVTIAYRGRTNYQYILGKPTTAERLKSIADKSRNLFKKTGTISRQFLCPSKRYPTGKGEVYYY